MTRLELAIGCTLLLFAAGCGSGASDTDDGPAKPKAVSFEGSVDARFIGSWKTPKESSCLDLRKDGTVQISSAVPSPKGISKSSLEGKWLVSGGDLILQYKVANQPLTTVKYPATLAGKEMTLVQGSRTKLTYIRS